MTVKICGIYKITNTLNGKAYVGQSVDIKRRWGSYKNTQKDAAHELMIDRAIKKYGINNFTFGILEQCTKQELNDREEFWIKELNTFSKNGYNLNTGGRKPTEISEETRKRQSKAHLGKKRTAQAIEKQKQSFRLVLENTDIKQRMSVSQKKRIRRTESYEKCSETWKKKIITREFRLRRSLIAMQGRKIVCSNGKTYSTMMEAIEDVGLSNSSIQISCREHRPVKGLTFRYMVPLELTSTISTQLLLNSYVGLIESES